MGPLYELTKENKFLSANEWKSEHNEAFEVIKLKLKSAPVLASPQLGHPFILETDASLKGIAAALLQKDIDGHEHPIAFFSQCLKPHQQKHHINELEALAVVRGLKQFRPYIEGSGVTVVRSDNSVICAKFFNTKPPLTGRMAKLLLDIKAFDITFEHKKGKLNKFCDYLSRHANVVESERMSERPEKEYCMSEFIEREKLIREQENEYGQLIKVIRQKNDESEGERKNLNGNFSFHQNLLWWSSDRDNDECCIVLPYAVRDKIISLFHCSKFIGGHLGPEKTFQKLKNRFYWPNMQTDVTKWVKSCPICQKAKSLTKPIFSHYAQSKNQIDLSHTIHVDLMGPLEMTESRKRYILLTVDGFSKFAVASPLANQKARSVATKLVDDVFTKFGVPRVVTTDQETQLMGEIFSDVADVMGFKHWPTTIYHQSANGQVERANGVVKTMLRCYEKEKNWDKDLQLLIFAYNNSTNTTTGDLPFFLLHGWEPATPLDVALKIHEKVGDPNLSYYKQELAKSVRCAWKKASEHIKREQKKYKEQYDKRRETKRAKCLKIGDLILKKVENYSSKFMDKWEGPFRIINVQKPSPKVT